MPRVVPSQIIFAIETMFGQLSELEPIQHYKKAEVRTLLELLDQVPAGLIDLQFHDLLEFERCRAALATALPGWNIGGYQPATPASGKNPVELIRRFMQRCHDELPEPESEFPFITNDDVRRGIEDRLRAARIDFDAREWLGATTSASVALEAILLWRVKQTNISSKKSHDDMTLGELINAACETSLISEDTAKQARLAQDARNLIHPGKVSRSGMSASKASALTALAAVYRVAEALNKALAGPATP